MIARRKSAQIITETVTFFASRIASPSGGGHNASQDPLDALAQRRNRNGNGSCGARPRLATLKPVVHEEI